ncbi:hypothetical protein DRW07_06710 [Alteromonas sediminis]|uniref:Uncharacterized protein n=1 Tax=Alteromonas sediminis TaxID=2259342 RepID=A0A3N5Y1V0_9ALTE|nr:tetratricopeptide repeat protein [Alteromonas sediminis]RPJ67220.1 hypothetical protein DRW07_06710 [Alteromonas sediminis]
MRFTLFRNLNESWTQFGVIYLVTLTAKFSNFAYQKLARGESFVPTIILSMILACCLNYSAGVGAEESSLINKSLTSAQWQQDLTYLADNVDANHIDFFSKHRRSDFDAAVSDVSNKLAQYDHDKMIVELAKLVSMARDGHSFIRGYHPLFENVFFNGMFFEPLPIRLYAFSDGIYVYAAHKDTAHLLGARVLKVNGLKTTSVLETVSAMFPVENEMNVLDWGVDGLVTPKVLKAFGVGDSAEQAVFTLSKEGKIFDVTLSAGEQYRPNLESRVVVDDDWVSFIEQVEKPLFLKHPERQIWFAHQPENGLVYLQINGYSKHNFEHILEVTKTAIDAAEADEETRFVLDLRLHPGGETEVVNPLVKALLASDINREGRFYVLIGRGTFSAAQLTVTALEQFSHAIFVGEPTGINIHFFGNARNRVTLPNSQLQVFLATSRWQQTNMGDSRVWKAPDIAARLSFSDYKQGIDPALTTILSGVEPKRIDQLIDGFRQRKLTLDEFVNEYHEFKANPHYVYQETEDIINALGYDLLSEQKFDAAITVLELNRKDYPDSLNAIDSLADANHQKGNLAKALALYQQVLARIPDDERVKELVAQIRTSIH